MNSLLYTDVLYDNDVSWGSFQLLHGLGHQTTYEFMLRKGFTPFYLDLYEFPREDNQQYLLDHYQNHLSNAQLLGLQIPDLSSVDLSNEDDRSDWLDYHAQVHANENTALGIQ